MQKAIFYHAGCPVCVSAEHQLLELLDRNRVDLEIVHLGEQAPRLQEAIAAGVKSVPALVSQGSVLHLNYGASLEDLS